MSFLEVETYCLKDLQTFERVVVVDQSSEWGWSEEHNARAACLYKFLALKKNTFDKLLEHCQVNGHSSTDIMLDDSVTST